MGFFNKKRNRRLITPNRFSELDPAVLENTKSYLSDLKMPEKNGRAWITIVNDLNSKTDPSMIRINADNTEYPYMNVGFAAASVVRYLRFQGIDSKIVADTKHFQKEDGRCCLTIDVSNSYSKEEQDAEEVPFVCIDREDNWAEHILDYAHRHFGLSRSNMRISKEDNNICFVSRNIHGKKKDTMELNLGIAMAKIMAAAEELWVDVDLKTRKEPGTLPYICRRERI